MAPTPRGIKPKGIKLSKKSSVGGRLSGLLQRVSFSSPTLQRFVKRSVTLLSLSAVVAAGAVAYDYKIEQDVDKNSPKQTKKKKVLVLDFSSMKIVEEKPPKYWRTMLSAALDSESSEDKVTEVEIRNLVDTIHAAADDPNIVALYGIFGHGFRFSAGGLAQVEEVRNALKVFRESHRIHWEPNKTHKSVLLRRGNATPKPMYAYADTFANPFGNTEFYLASIFSHIHLQQNGELQLFGLATSNVFLRDALKKYGIKVHVFKHGKYKTAPNVFTEQSYVREHKENTTTLVKSLNDQICDGIVQSRRGLTAFDNIVWTMIHNYGTFSASHVKRLGLVDFIPRLGPLHVLLQSNKKKMATAEEQNGNTMTDKSSPEKENGNNDTMTKEGSMPHSSTMSAIDDSWKNETDFDKFSAEESISFTKYSKLVEQRNTYQARKWKNYARLKRLAEGSAAAETVMSTLFGYSAPYFNIKKEDYSEAKEKSGEEKIALLNVTGAINDGVARKVAHSIRKIKKSKDIKAVVLRIDSPGGSGLAAENIFQELKELKKPVVCSMGNVAASAGYYIATDCKRIFAMPTTITGSIGVFGLKFDLSEMAAQYGVNVEHVATGPHSTSYNLFQPMTKPVKTNFSRNVDRFYDYFKQLVSNGRGMTMSEVEAIAQGRVWTGEQAKQVGLVDEHGGLVRAISYAQNNFTSGDAAIEVWPKQTSFLEKFLKRLADSDEEEKEDDTEDSPTMSEIGKAFISMLAKNDGSSPSAQSRDAQHHFLSQILGHAGSYNLSTMPTSLSGIMMTIDENEAIKCLLTDQSHHGWSALPGDCE
mmetsp:Transcript_2571/g.3616  ORF Transcript_2571/g.3616 Transcript_2571/m.3616 type:complete len:815 (-) Transcript_2571:6-2450(-)